MTVKRFLKQFGRAAGLLVAVLMVTWGAQAYGSTLDVGPDGIVRIQINGSPVALQVRGDWMSYPTLNPDAAQRLGVRGNIIANMLGIQAVVGTTTIPGHTGRAKFLIDGKDIGQRVLWFEKPVSPRLDGVVGPGALPQSEIRLNTGLQIEHATVFSVPAQSINHKIGTLLKVDGESVFVMFDPSRQRSIASAAAGQAISMQYGGEWSGGSGQENAEFGVNRPVRELQLVNPVVIGSLRLKKMLVRDYSRVRGVEENKIDQEILDPSEVTLPAVTVTASVKSKVKPLYYLTLGRDVLDRCVSITFKKGANQIEFACEE